MITRFFFSLVLLTQNKLLFVTVELHLTLKPATGSLLQKVRNTEWMSFLVMRHNRVPETPSSSFKLVHGISTGSSRQFYEVCIFILKMKKLRSGGEVTHTGLVPLGSTQSSTSSSLYYYIVLFPVLINPFPLVLIYFESFSSFSF